tara:strand:+ start:623 stop:1018 length:396 start_codon:yes stop_codon:yes gene_type:complete
MNYGLEFPISRSDIDGLTMIKDVKKLVSFHLKNLLFTSPGEKISDPSYGVGIKRYLFEPLTGATKNIIKDNIKTQIRTNLSYLNLKGIDVSSSEDDSSVSISIKYQVSGTKISDIVNYDISLATQSAPSLY